MKKNLRNIIVLLIILLIFVFNGCNGVLFELSLYDAIIFNGRIYATAKSQEISFDDYDAEEITVYVMRKGKIDYKHKFNAYGFQGDVGRIYLFFDGRIFGDIDYVDTY